ncbi:MAG: GNAT family N-acetyltransferase [Candidatus Thermoplasmatota archaeon]|nr:GNAT family N-acetyltransferase [Candidatus Thermoplasmatota archaeon]
MLEKRVAIPLDDLMLREYRPEDAPDIVRQINDEQISRYTLNIPYPYGMKDAEDFLTMNRTWSEQGVSLNLAITLKGEDRVIGGIGLMNIEEKFKHAGIGYWLGRSYRGHNYATRCVGVMVRFGFEKLGLWRISAVVFSPNERSRRVLIKNGFVHEGTMRSRYVLDGKRVDGEVYGLIPADLKKQPVH